MYFTFDLKVGVKLQRIARKSGNRVSQLTSEFRKIIIGFFLFRKTLDILSIGYEILNHFISSSYEFVDQYYFICNHTFTLKKNNFDFLITVFNRIDFVNLLSVRFYDNSPYCRIKNISWT